ncbi:hypothetical protein AGABI1DRAFT_36770 [Agaricus bisporus var. burnettii JB137-S8]|uniref:Conserved oligomeric Golgi complex subunit 2 n=1 Tax=Agaricus bisporus var. burnettii (strain JB137-S8 / ATCC MYA-4627 / FGSC 10392) TaxID=597362 RepID=K5W2H5_AGABU|nr:uncharacterized protein AGABI1DRAFT_36770 [Agaricus bisporus var. burnettii JB137-S8]EKM80999.1 hypothetical protein AGABI1DRAFT_36770 [Agaricus bisporus var. burnettii JB137-S8]
MSSSAPTNSAFINTRDPYQLERLAEELANRETNQRNNASPSDVDIKYTDLPDYGPLSHHNPLLTGPVFNVEEFLLSRARASLPELRTELRDYLSVLKEELVQLINNDYEAFISLSTDLRSEGSRLKKMRGPLVDLQDRIMDSRKELQAIQAAIQEKLDQRATLREEKALLHLLLKISESLTRLESLLMITYHHRDRSNRAKHVTRVAVEYTQLLYHVSKAREENCVFVDELQWRIDRIQSTLSSDLDLLFAGLLAKMKDSKPGNRLPEMERTKLLYDLREYFRTYDMLGLWRDAEDVLRREVVRPFLKKTIFQNALGAPHSPVIPKTPFHLEPRESVFLRTPYTPFTAFSPQNLSTLQTSNHLTTPPQALLAEDGNDPLVQVYNQILRHVIWEEVANAVINDLGDSIFAAGRPDDLRRNYDTTQNFLRCLELYAPSVRAVHAMREHELYREFEKRWQLPVYFQLRWKEIVADVEVVFTDLRLEPSSVIKGVPVFLLAQTKALWKAVAACWSPEILIPELSHRFWRLTLQLLSRYGSWLNSVYAIVADSNPALRLATSTSSEVSSTEATAIEDVLLRQYTAVLSDIDMLENKVDGLWKHEISIVLPPEMLESVDATSNHLVSILTKRCREALRPVQSIPTQFRAMSNKRLPTEPSYFVQTIFRPLKSFFADGPGLSLKDSYRSEYSQEIFKSVAHRYISYLTAMRKTEESLRKLKKAKKATFSLFGGATDDDSRDEERIRTQMILDVEAFGKEAQSLGIDIATNEDYESLKNTVLASDRKSLR